MSKFFNDYSLPIVYIKSFKKNKIGLKLLSAKLLNY